MKLRITSTSIRLRLSQTDVKNFAENGLVEETLTLGPSDDQKVTYRLERDGSTGPVLASFTNNTLTVSVPADRADEWTSTELVGLDNHVASGDVRIVVEKDFTCLTPRAGEDDLDTFPHPKAGKEC